MPYIGKEPAKVPVTAADIPDNSITAAKIVDGVITAADIGANAVGNSEMADDAVGIAELSATGTASNTTFLRGDNSWQTAGSTSASDLTSGTLPIARIADGAVTAAKVAADVATQAELDTVSTVASAALPKVGGTMTGDLNFGDNVDANFGASADLKIHHSGSHSLIQDSGTGNLIIQAADLTLGSITGETYATFADNGAASIYYDNAVKLATTATGATVTGTLVESSPTNAVTTIVTNDNVAVRNFGSSFANVDTTWYKWDLPSSGTYLIGGNYRAIQWTRNGFCKVRLYNNTASAAINNSDRMLLESGNNSNTLNVGVCPTWVVTVTAATLIYLQGKSSSPTGSGGSGIQEDYNGNNECWHARMY